MTACRPFDFFGSHYHALLPIFSIQYSGGVNDARVTRCNNDTLSTTTTTTVADVMANSYIDNDNNDKENNNGMSSLSSKTSLHPPLHPHPYPPYPHPPYQSQQQQQHPPYDYYDDDDRSMPGLQEKCSTDIDMDCDTCSTSEAMVSQCIYCIVIIIITTICIYDRLTYIITFLLHFLLFL